MKKLIVLFLLLGGCAGNSGIVPTGSDTFMVSRQGAISTQSETGLVAEAYRDANAYCDKLGKQMVSVSSRSKPGQFGSSYPEAEIRFRCDPKK